MARSVFYYHLKRLKSSDKYAEEKDMIESIFHEHKVAMVINALQRRCKTEALQSIIKSYED